MLGSAQKHARVCHLVNWKRSGVRLLNSKVDRKPKCVRKKSTVGGGILSESRSIDRASQVELTEAWRLFASRNEKRRARHQSRQFCNQPLAVLRTTIGNAPRPQHQHNVDTTSGQLQRTINTSTTPATSQTSQMVPTLPNLPNGAHYSVRMNGCMNNSDSVPHIPRGPASGVSSGAGASLAALRP